MSPNIQEQEAKRESELNASLISAARERNKSSGLLYRDLDQRDPAIRFIHWLCFPQCPCLSVFFLLEGFGRARNLTWFVTERRRFLSILRSVQIHFVIQRGSFVSDRGAKEHQS